MSGALIPPAGVASCWRLSPSRTTGLGQVGLPALVVHGSADALVDPSGGRRTADAIPGARFVLLGGMGHDTPPEYWDEMVDLVTAHTGQVMA
jgi:pimeloyl-ACP methyl ester carboxylesterase